MATYKIAFENDVYPDKGTKELHVPDDKIRQYSTIVNTAIAKVLAQAGVLLTLSEDGSLSADEMQEKGLNIKVEQG